MPISPIGIKNLSKCFFARTKLSLLELETSSHRNHDSQYDDQTHQSFFRNYNSLYNNNNTTTAATTTRETETDFASVFASNRFFFSSPGLSSSIIDSYSTTPSIPSSSSSSSISSREEASMCKVKESSLVVPRCSPDPYADFRRSMQEMVEARELLDVKADWEYLHELLLYYLVLNPKSAHKVIVSAFADLLVTLLSSSST